MDAYRVFHWRISNYRNAGKKLTSPEFECGGHKWNILLFPNGNVRRRRRAEGDGV